MKKQKVHFSRRAHATACGAKIRGNIQLTAISAKVTCQECIVALDKDEMRHFWNDVMAGHGQLHV